jgi:hypothetical protein
MTSTDLLPAALVAGYTIATHFAVDLANRAYRERCGRDLPGWAKQALSLVVAALMTTQAHVDAFAPLRHGGETVGGYLLTALVLAGLASQVAHPAIESAKAAARRVAGAPAQPAADSWAPATAN